MTSKHVWTPGEDERFLEAMLELKEKGTHNNNEKGCFVKGHQKVLEEKLPDHGLKEKHISSHCKTLRIIWATLFDLINKGNGFGWHEEKKMVVAPPSVWNEYVKSHPDAASLKGKPFKFYDELGIIYGTERATRKDVKAPGDMLEDLKREENIGGDENTIGDDFDDLVSTTQLPTESSREESFKKFVKKRARAMDSLIACLDHLTDVVGNELEEGRHEFARIADIFKVPEKKRETNKYKLNNELRKIVSLSFEEKHRVRMKLVHNADLLDYFLSLRDDEKEHWVRWYLSTF